MLSGLKTLRRIDSSTREKVFTHLTGNPGSLSGNYPLTGVLLWILQEYVKKYGEPGTRSGKQEHLEALVNYYI
jgi:hypothetical protein